MVDVSQLRRRLIDAGVLSDNKRAPSKIVAAEPMAWIVETTDGRLMVSRTKPVTDTWLDSGAIVTPYYSKVPK